MTHTVNNRFQKAVDYKTYLLASKLAKINQTVLTNISKISKRLSAQMRQLF